ncbi:dTDP-glucose 4,6-dehydratase [Paenibacillus sp. YYML68]|uniref:dTDP-glucose 4,6-dehydratase n=1 Tax=Paenibacillus sp. YYML68 TaxID=2909250 RepID=UPI0024903B80|nr:dTDP-glucose 4,6-dehydratase [Paenibacillus sp. YYML68]
MRTILVTGGCGFIGSNFIKYWASHHPHDRIVNLDLLTYAGNPNNVAELEGSEQYRFVKADIADAEAVARLFDEEKLAAVVHFAAESHVDRSIRDAGAFVRTNVMGTLCLLEEARRHQVARFVHVSTDEVYGSLGDEGLFTEETPLAPNSPYSASKAGSDLMARAYFETYGLPVMTTRCSNNYGPYQHPEKLIPTIITRALQDQLIPVYGDGTNVRDWLHVEDHCAAIALVLLNGKPGEVYNIGGHNERRNLDIVRTVLQQLGKPETLIQYVQDRLGHDRRYAIDPSKMTTELGWKPKYKLDDGLTATIEWYQHNEAWWRELLTRGDRG